MDERQYWRRIAALAQELEKLLDREGDKELDNYLLDTDTAVGQLWRGLPWVREYAQERLDRLRETPTKGDLRTYKNLARQPRRIQD